MPWYKRLRYRLIGSQLIVVLVGVLSVLFSLYIFLPFRLEEILLETLSPLGLRSDLLAGVQGALQQSINGLFRNFVLVAAAIAFVVGLVSSLVLWLIIITPLRRIAQSSQRIAEGRYDERVIVPSEAGEAMAILATNFNQMAEGLENVENARMTLLGNVTHELRTPLSSLSGYIEGLSDGIFQPGEKVYASMGAQIGRLSRLIEDIQTLSRVEAGEIQLNMQTLEVAKLIEQTILALQPKILSHEIEISRQLPAEPLFILADADRVSQILMNLLSNGLQHTPAGGRIEIVLSKAKQNCRIEVIDNGKGIPPEALPFLFERFYRVDQSRARQKNHQGGSGVGLTISRHLAWAMGGGLTADSDGLGSGSRFVLELPLAKS